jgi:chromosome segregation ATPase
LQNCQRALEKERQEIAEMETSESIDPKIEELEAEKRKIADSLDKIGSDKADINEKVEKLQRDITRTKHKLAEFDSIRERRLIALRNMRVDDEIRAYKWIEQNKQKFQGNVYFLPLEISVKENLHAQYLENHCPRWLLQSFVCDNGNDKEFIIQELIEKQKLKITVTYVDYSPGLPDRICDINDLRKYGITHFLDEVFDAPAIVKQAMNDNAQLFKVACGTDKTADTWNEMFHKTPVKSAFSPSSRYLAKFSRYGDKEMSISIITLKPLKIFQGIDMSLKRSLEEEKGKLNEQIRKLMTDMKDVQESDRNARMEQEKIQAKVNLLLDKRKKYMQKRNAINSLEREYQRLITGEDTASEELRINGNIAEINKKRVTCATELSNKTEKYVDLSLKLNKYILEERIFKQLEDRYKMEKQEEEQKKRKLMSQVDEIEERYNHIKNELKVLKDNVEKCNERYFGRHPDTKVSFSERLEALPDTAEEVRYSISIAQAKANDIHEDPKVIQEYEKTKEELKKKTRDLEELEKELTNYNNKMEELKAEWLAELEPCIEHISNTFASYCKNIGISGEVSLGREKEFDKWSIQIKVRFRDNESLTVLSANRQSGGERSVTTMLYLLSLQQLNKCPFRVVDEINQGMDLQNERKIFYLMLDSSRGRDAPQSFLITPKLLPNLVPNHANNITILFIYNGPHNNLSDVEWHKYQQAITEGNGNVVNGIHSSDQENEDTDE